MRKVQKNLKPEEILNRRIGKIQRGREWKQNLAELAGFVAVVFVVFTYVIGFAQVKGESMVPALQEREILLYYRLDENYHPGDVVIFRLDGQVEYVKRIVAVEGDEVDLDRRTGLVLINGEPLEEPYIYTETFSVSEGVTFPLTVEEGCVFVLGDNRGVSRDSREFGCVKESDILGRVLWHCGRMR